MCGDRNEKWQVPCVSSSLQQGYLCCHQHSCLLVRIGDRTTWLHLNSVEKDGLLLFLLLLLRTRHLILLPSDHVAIDFTSTQAGARYRVLKVLVIELNEHKQGVTFVIAFFFALSFCTFTKSTFFSPF